MNFDEIKALLIETITNYQEYNGRPVEKIDGSSKPLYDLYDFDSLNAFEVANEISAKLETEIDVKIFGISRKSKQPEETAIDEIAQNILDIITK